MYFAYHRRSKPTGELLAQILQFPYGDDPESSIVEGSEQDILIRWGSRRNEYLDEEYDRAINPSSAIKLCSDKIASSETMDNWNPNEEYVDAKRAINVPPFSTNPHELIAEFGYPLLGRKRQHARGTDIKLILQERDLRNCGSDYFTVYVPTKREFRIHVVGDKVIRIQGKYLDDPTKKVAHIRNYTTGYRFRAPRLRLKPDRLTMAVEAVKSLGLDFGAVDLIVADNGSCYVLEVNTAPSCSPLTLGAYAVALHELCGLDSEIDMSVVDMLDNSIEDMDSDDEVENE